jgi:hypothetical protein
MEQVGRLAVERSNRPGSSSSTRSTRSPGVKQDMDPTSLGKGPEGLVAHRGRDGGLFEIRHGPNRTHLVHRRGRFHVTKPSDLIPELKGASIQVERIL